LMQSCALGLLLVLFLAGYKYYTATPFNAEVTPSLPSDCPDCGHKHGARPSSHASSDLSIKLARGRKDLYGANNSIVQQPR
jgi:hypothetical protein